MRKTKTQSNVDERVNLTKEFLNSQTGKDFRAWWKNHRHSGYAVKGNDEWWAIPPGVACNTDRYMAEFCADRNLEERLRFEYTAFDYERWAKEQKKADDAVAKFAAEHNGREIPTREECIEQIQKASAMLARKFQTSGEPRGKTESQIHEELHAFEQKFKPAESGQWKPSYESVAQREARK